MHVDFYILPDNQLISLQQYACRLAESNWQQGQRVLIQTSDASESKQLDELLWNLQENSFIPHGIASLEPVDEQQPILISHQPVNTSTFDTLINLSDQAIEVEQPTASKKLYEVLNQEEQRKQLARIHYKIYRERGYSLEHHTLEADDAKI